MQGEREFGSETVTPPEVRDFPIAAAAHIHEVLEMVPGLHEPASEPDQEILEMLRRALHRSGVASMEDIRRRTMSGSCVALDLRRRRWSGGVGGV